jgi:hypothetical protein
MLKVMEFVLLGAAVAVIAGLIFAGPKSAPPMDGEPPLGAAENHSAPEDGDGKHTIA